MLKICVSSMCYYICEIPSAAIHAIAVQTLTIGYRKEQIM